MNRSNMPKQIMNFANGGLASFIPRQTRIMGQPHMLAYINPREEQILQDYRGNAPVVAGPAGIPSYLFGFDSIADMFDGGGKGGSGASFSTKSHEDYVRDNPNDTSARAHTDDDDDRPSNTFTQTVANILTPGDDKAYVGGELVEYDDRNNTLGQTLTNIVTPFDNQEYVGGNLVDYDNYGALLPPIPGNDLASSDADGDGIDDAQEFATLYNAQSEAAANDPTGQSTGTGFIAGSDFSADIDGDGTPENYESGTQYAVNTDGSVAVAGSAEDLTGGMSQLDSALVNQGLAEDYNNDGVISFDETFGADSTVSSNTSTDTTGGGDDGGSNTTDGGDDGSEEGGDDDTSTTAPPSSVNFRFFGGYQPRTREDVLVASPGADQPFEMPDDPRITPIYTPGNNIDTTLSPTAIGPTEGYGTAPVGPIPEATTTVPVFGQPGTIATPGPGMPGQGQFATMQELMEYQQQYPNVNLMGEYQRLKALEGGAAQPAVLPQRGVASLMSGQPVTEAMYQGIMS